MEPETEAVQDYYVLFRDTAVPAPTDAEYKIRCEQRDVLVGDRAAYVWGYVGKLNDSQAKKVQKRLNSRLDKRFRNERAYSNPYLLEDEREITFLRRGLSEIRVILHKRVAQDFIAQVSPNLAFFSHVPFAHVTHKNRNIRIYPESAEEEQKIVKALSPRSFQCHFGFKFFYNPEKNEPLKRYCSFVELLSSETLVDIWRCFGLDGNMDLLRRTAGIWVIQTLEKSTIYTSRGMIDPEKAKNAFQLTVQDVEGYILKLLTRHQKIILAQCAHNANIVRKADGCEDKNIDNIYTAMKWRAEEENRSASPPTQTASHPGTSPIIPVGKFTEQAEVPMDVPGGTPRIILAARITDPNEKESEATDDTSWNFKDWLKQPHVPMPDDVALKGIDPDAQKEMMQVHYEAGLLLKYADEVDEWHIISKTKYKGAGWVSIARAKLERDKQAGKIKSYREEEVTNLSNQIRRAVLEHRQNLEHFQK